MAYARHGPGSDVYVWPGDGWIVCQACRLSPVFLGEFDAETCEAMIAHLGEHVAAGHHVPDGVVAELREDAKRGLDSELVTERRKYQKEATDAALKGKIEKGV